MNATVLFQKVNAGQVVDNMVEIGQRAASFNSTRDPGYGDCLIAWETYVFQLGVSLAHEIVHLLTGFLCDTTDRNTPPTVTFDDFGSELQGEAGWNWEGLLFGGQITFHENRNDPLGLLQAGVPILVDNEEVTMRLISQRYIRRFLTLEFDGMFPWLIPCITDAVTHIQ